MIIIATVGRSGSSLMMEYMKEIDLGVGDLRWVHKIDAGNESSMVTNINARLRNHIMGSKKLSKPTIKDICKSVPLQVIKDPQFLIHPEMIRLWWMARKDITVMYLRRDPEKIVKSIYRHPYFNTPAYRCNVELIKKHEAEFLQILKDLNIKHVILEFPNFFDQLGTINKFIKESGYNVTKYAPLIWKKLINPKKVHV